jgi:hypothetical protein
MSFPKELTNPAQANGPSIVNEMFEAIAASAMYARNYDTSTGLVLGYFGGHIAGSAIADGTTTLAASEANVYVVAHRTTGAVTSATNTTNWNSTGTYGRLYHAVTGGSTITTLTDWREQTGGWFDRVGVAGAVDAAAVTYTPTTLADWDGSADPGNVDDALDQLAERVADVEGAGGGDASSITYTPTTAADWDGSTDPGNVDDALDQLAERTADLEGVSGIGGSTGSTDNTVLRANGTGGSTVQSTGVVIGDADEISGYLANVNLQTGTSYTIDVAGSDTDAGKIIDHANGSAIAVTLPATAPVGFACTYVQTGAGQITFASTGSGTLANRQSHTKTAGNKAMVTLYVRANAGGSAAAWILGGDTAA